jgi:hypothetical protein
MLPDYLSLENPLVNLILRFSVNTFVLFIIIRVIYYRYSKNGELLFSFFLMGIMIFLICFLLETVEIQIGMALGLFAIFSILRFRTSGLSVKDMSYIFACIGVSVINSQAYIAPPIIGAVAVNTIIIISILVLELFLQRRTYSSFTIIYHNPELLNPAKKTELINDLTLQTGFSIEKVKIKRIDIGKSNAEIIVYYRKDNTVKASPVVNDNIVSAE